MPASARMSLKLGVWQRYVYIHPLSFQAIYSMNRHGKVKCTMASERNQRLIANTEKLAVGDMMRANCYVTLK